MSGQGDPALSGSQLVAPGTRTTSVRVALILSSLSRYAVMLTGLLATFIVARFLTPAEFGLAVLGGAIFPIADSLRDLGAVAYIVQHKNLSREHVRTAFTASLVVTLIGAAAIFMLARPVAVFFDAPTLETYIHVLALDFLLGPFGHPVYSLMSRDLAFGRIALIDILTALANAGVSVALVMMGWGVMALAWAAVTATALSTVLSLVLQRGLWVYRPSLRHARELLSFGVSGSSAALLARAAESASYLLFGKLLGPAATGLLQRAMLIGFWPERILLAGLGAVALPAFSTLQRQGEPLAPHYLKAIAMASAVNWSALVTVALLAGPLVDVLLGPRWAEVVPLVQIIVLSAVFTFPNGLNAGLQIAAGGIGKTPLIVFLQYGVGMSAVAVGATFGPEGVAWSLLAAAPFGAAVSTLFVRRLVPFAWRDYVLCLAPSLTLAFATALPLWLTVNFSGVSSPVLVCLAGFCASGVGLLAGLSLVPHPLRDEALRIARGALRRLRERKVGA